MTDPANNGTRSAAAAFLAREPENPIARSEYEHSILKDIDSAIANLPDALSARKRALAAVLGDASMITQESDRSAIIEKLVAVGVSTKRVLTQRLARLLPLALTKTNGAAQPQVLASVSEDTLATCFTRRHSENWRYVAAWSQWYKWDSTRWAEEKTLLAFDLARSICRDAAREILQQPGNQTKAAAINRASTAAAVERLAKAAREHASTSGQWDQDPWLLNTTTGIVNLKTGDLQPHDRAYFMTKRAAAAPAISSQDAPQWLAFLATITNNDLELQAYLKRIIGYAITGVTTEQVLFFLYGTGANGKGVFMNTLTKVLGDYVQAAHADTFMASKMPPHPTDLAGLQGARLVNVGEIDQGKRWAESKLKSVTGGDTISARFMHGNFFEYRPQFKLFIAGNYKPAIRGVDEAMKRRLYLIPFMVTIPPERRNTALENQLLLERDGILAWAIEGCLEWQRIGLKPPRSVLQATEEYFDTEDALGQWIEERCSLDINSTALTNALFTNWKQWADTAGERAESMKWFCCNLQTRGYTKWRQGGTGKYGFKGISLIGTGEYS